MICKVPDKPRLSIRNKTNQKILFYVFMNVDIQHTFTIYYKYKDVILSIKYIENIYFLYTHIHPHVNTTILMWIIFYNILNKDINGKKIFTWKKSILVDLAICILYVNACPLGFLYENKLLYVK